MQKDLNVSLRSKVHISIPYYKNLLGQKSLNYRCSILYNKLPIDIRNLENAIQFKTKLKAYCLNFSKKDINF